MSLATPHSAFAQAGDAKKGIEAGKQGIWRGDCPPGTPEASSALYTGDAVAMPPYGEAVTGRPAIEKALSGGDDRERRQGSDILTAKEVEAHGDTATEVGAYGVKDAAGKEIDRGN